MYTYVRRCLITSTKSYIKFFTQSFHDASIASKSYANTRYFWNNVAYKRLYCQTAINDANQTNTQTNNQTNANVKDISQQTLDKFLSDLNNKKFFQILVLEIDVLRHNAERIPDKITPKDWLELLSLKSKTQRKKYLAYLWSNEKSNEKMKAKKEKNKSEWLDKKAESEQIEDTGEMKYGLTYNSLFLRIYDGSMKNFYNSRLINAMMFEPKVVFDCSYENHMNLREIHNCAKQLTLAFAANRTHVSPMCLHYCNLNTEGQLMYYFQRNIPSLQDDDFPAIVTSQSYLDLFPKDQLLYLTPHCRTDMIEYDPDTVYIIGAMVDKSNPKPLSLAKAKKEGLRMARIPIERYLDWGSGSSKNLTLNQILIILLAINHTRDWKEALKNVPTRKLKQAREHLLHKKLKQHLLHFKNK